MTKREFTLPGQKIGEGRAGRGTFAEDNIVYSKIIGLVEKRDDLIFVIPLSGIYTPSKGDGIIGKIREVTFSKWIVDINSPYDAVLPLNDAVDEYVDLSKTDLTRYFDFEDLIFTEVSLVTKSKSVQLSMKDRKCRKLRGGIVINVTPAKVPRIIGRGGSMVEMIKELTDTQIVVGQNGLVWIKGDKKSMAAEAVLEIESKSQSSGLTEHIKNMLEERTGNKCKTEVDKDE